MRLSLVCLSLISISCLSYAQSTEELITDRPDFTESAIVVPTGALQIESGFEYTDEAYQGGHSQSYPKTLIRYGLSDKLELRFDTPGWQKNNQGGGTVYTDNEVGLKVQIGSRKASRPMAVLLHASLPTGDNSVSTGRSDLSAVLSHSFDLNESYSFATNVGANYIYNGTDRDWQGLASASIAMDLAENVGAFVETYFTATEKQVWQPVLDGGITYGFADNQQLDFYIGTGLNQQAPDLIVGAGYSIRL